MGVGIDQGIQLARLKFGSQVEGNAVTAVVTQ